MELKAQLEKENMSYKRQHMVRDLVALYDLSPFSSLLGCVLDHTVTSNFANRMHSPHVVDCNLRGVMGVWLGQLIECSEQLLCSACTSHDHMLMCRSGASARQRTLLSSCQTWLHNEGTPEQRWRRKHMRCGCRAPWPLRGSSGSLLWPSCCGPSKPPLHTHPACS